MIRVTIDTVDAGVMILTLDRAEKRNALTPPMLRELTSAARSAAERGARALVLAGAGSVFCAGFDLAMCRDEKGATAALLTTLSEAMRAIRAAPIPVIGAAQGGGIAGGCALLTACDFVLSDAAATFGYPVVRIGVSPAVSAPTLSLLVPDGHLRELLINPQLIGGAEALRLGMLHSVVDAPERVMPAALELARALSAKPPHSLGVTKRWLNELDGTGDDSERGLARRALEVSLGLAGGEEERTRLAQLSL